MVPSVGTSVSAQGVPYTGPTFYGSGVSGVKQLPSPQGGQHLQIMPLSSNAKSDTQDIDSALEDSMNEDRQATIGAGTFSTSQYGVSSAIASSRSAMTSMASSLSVRPKAKQVLRAATHDRLARALSFDDEGGDIPLSGIQEEEEGDVVSQMKSKTSPGVISEYTPGASSSRGGPSGPMTRGSSPGAAGSDSSREGSDGSRKTATASQSVADASTTSALATTPQQHALQPRVHSPLSLHRFWLYRLLIRSNLMSLLSYRLHTITRSMNSFFSLLVFPCIAPVAVEIPWLLLILTIAILLNKVVNGIVNTTLLYFVDLQLFPRPESFLNPGLVVHGLFFESLFSGESRDILINYLEALFGEPAPLIATALASLQPVEVDGEAPLGPAERFEKSWGKVNFEVLQVAMSNVRFWLELFGFGVLCVVILYRYTRALQSVMLRSVDSMRERF